MSKMPEVYDVSKDLQERLNNNYETILTIHDSRKYATHSVLYEDTKVNIQMMKHTLSKLITQRLYEGNYYHQGKKK